MITPICEEATGWLVAATVRSTAMWAADKPTPDQTRTLWLVPAKGDPMPLERWAIGPIFDFDGDGVSEVSTWFTGATSSRSGLTQDASRST